MDSREAASHVRIVVKPYASALPLGCFSFAIGNALYSAFLLHWLPASEHKLLAVTLLSFVAPLESIACWMAFLSRDTGAATAMGIFAASWVAQGVVLLEFGAAPSPTIGVLLINLAVCLAIILFITYRGKPLLAVVIAFALLRTGAAAAVELGAKGPFPAIAAGLGFCVCLSAFYAGLALLVEDVKGKIMPFTLRSADAENAMAGSFEDQMSHVVNEAGVRHQL
ncbi:GPR1/FUN34/YaaH family transporter [Acidipila sp. EB88]|uniref:GPR1/FUN34/YaaH family transporter n=1 Tax=Acidipila sp. EB88 TaxID=2305226 RepID=UPI00131565DD|nr:GPR1/FUN34/YaaH family transporter [Acidipila sp. EB88]